MEKDYLCPHCRSHLRVGNYIIFSSMNSKGEKGLLLLSPELGDYTVLNHPHYKFNKGEKVTIFCPLCSTNLTVPEIDNNIAKVILIDENKNEYEIYFSEIAGERCTYKIFKGNVEEAFGDDMFKYINYFGHMPRNIF